MKKNFTYLLLLTVIVASSCNRRAYYLSPFNANSNSYYTKPMVADSVKSAFYASGGASLGWANYQGSDNLYNAQFSLHRSHTGTNIQAFYGVTAALGLYRVKALKNDSTLFFDPYEINKGGADQFFGGVWFNGGVNAVIPFEKAEWRVLGIQAAWGKEWGDYYQFRRSLADSAASTIYKDDRFGNIGLTTEVVWRLKNNGAIGMKFAYGETFYRKNIDLSKSTSTYTYYLEPGYYTGTFHVTKENTTFYMQFNKAAYATILQFGVNCKIASGKHR